MSNIPVITNVENLEGKTIFLRTSLNVPIEGTQVRNSFRIEQSLETIQFLLNKNAKVILCSHLGKDGEQSLVPVFEVLKKHINVVFSPEVTGDVTTALVQTLQNGQALLLENVRKDQREMQNEAGFAQELAQLADIFVNDDFAAAHRAHASLHAICSYLPSYVGINFNNEYQELSKALTPESPSLFILGGAKFETKVPLVEKFLTLYDHIFIGGAIANDFFKAQGHEVGTSLVSEMSLEDSPLLGHPKIILPIDVTVAKDGVRRECEVTDVHTDESILDVGPKTIEMLGGYIADAKTILWNGPLGNYEGGYQEHTFSCAKLIAESSAFTVVGGGDTVASIETLKNQDKYSFLSTAGGAMLTFLELGSLPALDAILETQ